MAFSILYVNDAESGGRAKILVTAAEDGAWAVQIEAASPRPAAGARTRIRWEEIVPFLGWGSPFG